MARPVSPPSLSRASVEKQAQDLLEITQRWELGEQSNHIRDRLNNVRLGLLILIVGEGNFGKSSLVNALAGQIVAPVSNLPQTYKVDVYTASPDNREFAELRWSDDPRLHEHSLASARELSVQEERAVQAGSPPRERSLVEAIWYRTGLRYGPELCLVDTPGLAQCLTDGHEESRSRSLVKGLGAADKELPG